ncbi:MAG: dihydroorotase family protein [Crenarchaeota archaeon]|nr:dihydroorotase family protein [Thermoproteota archaeon]
MRILLEGARVLVNNRILRRADIIIDEDKGTIDRICISPPRSEYDIKIRLQKDMIILPGFVDIHVHCRDWNQKHKETIETCSRAAARGGVVKIFDMPNTSPPLNTPERIRERIEYAKTRSIVEYYVHGGAPERVEDLKEYVRVGVRSVKLYPEDIERLRRSGEIERFLKICEEDDILIIIHCEDIELIRRNMEKIPHEFSNHSLIRCRESEISCVQYFLSLLEKYNCRVHFTHISTRSSILQILLSRSRGDISFDVTPHHMLLTYDLCVSNVKFEGICKVNPPLRDNSDRDFILLSVIEEVVGCVVSDHAPHALEEKLKDYDSCPPGFPGLETTSLILLTLWRLGLIDLVDVVKLYCENPCKIVRIKSPLIREGERADLCIVDISAEQIVNPLKFLSMAKYSPFENLKLGAKIVATVLRGRTVYIDEEYLSVFSK